MTRDEEFIYFAAFRYALPRQTYAPDIVIREIMAHIHEFPTDSIKQMIEEIDRELDLIGNLTKELWIEFKYSLQQTLKERENANS